MARNGKPGKGRVGAVKGRKQFYNSNNDTWYKINAGSGRIMGGKTGAPYKGVSKI